MKLKILFSILLVFCTMEIIFAKPSKQDIIEQFTNLHKKIYKVFDFQNDNVIYNYLSYIYTDNALDEEYFYFLKQIRELKTNNSVNIIQRIRYNKIEILKKTRNKVVLSVNWEVQGIVRHQLHEHDRTNFYEAKYTLVYDKTESAYKIDKTEILKSKRIDSAFRYY